MITNYREVPNLTVEIVMLIRVLRFANNDINQIQ